jgi:hypothetical protein
MLFCYAWLKLAPPEYHSYLHFNDLVVLSLMGDDSIGTVSDKVKQWFNMKAISIVWAELGIQVKVEAANEGDLLSRQFISQGTRLFNKQYVPVPEYDKSVSTMLWHTKSHLHIRWSYLKACALRMYTFWCIESRMLFESYIKWLESKYYSALHSDTKRTSDDPYSFDEVYVVYRDNWSMVALYTYPESQPAISSKSDLKRAFAPGIQEYIDECCEIAKVQEKQEVAEEAESSSSASEEAEC